MSDLTVKDLPCRKCRQALKPREIRASAAPALGPGERSGSWLCDACWGDYCDDLSGRYGLLAIPPGVDGVDR